VIVSNSTNINKTNNHLSPQTSEHKRKTMTSRSWLRTGTKMWQC